MTTVTRAYKMCQEKGLVYAVPGSGTYVSSPSQAFLPDLKGGTVDGVIDLGSDAFFDQCNDIVASAVKKVAVSSDIENIMGTSIYETRMAYRSTAVNWLRNLGLKTDGDHLFFVSGCAVVVDLQSGKEEAPVGVSIGFPAVFKGQDQLRCRARFLCVD